MLAFHHLSCWRLMCWPVGGRWLVLTLTLSVINAIPHVVILVFEGIHAGLVLLLATVLIILNCTFHCSLIFKAHLFLTGSDGHQVIQPTARLLSWWQISSDAVNVRQLGVLVTSQHFFESNRVLFFLTNAFLEWLGPRQCLWFIWADSIVLFR